MPIKRGSANEIAPFGPLQLMPLQATRPACCQRLPPIGRNPNEVTAKCNHNKSRPLTSSQETNLQSTNHNTQDNQSLRCSPRDSAGRMLPAQFIRHNFTPRISLTTMSSSQHHVPMLFSDTLGFASTGASGWANVTRTHVLLSHGHTSRFALSVTATALTQRHRAL
jgi:hypothetical protein